MLDSPQPRIAILFAGRYPSEKAAAIFADLSAASFTGQGMETLVIAPRRLDRGRAHSSAYKAIYLPVLDFSKIPLVWSIANYITVATFAKWLWWWLLFNRKAEDVYISNDVLPLLVATFWSKRTLYEMHDFPDRSLWMYRLLFKRVQRILVTNEWKFNEMKRLYPQFDDKLLLERNAVDVEAFGKISKSDARRQLKLSQDRKIAIYTGHLYEWKGADTLAKAAVLIPDIEAIFVGGTVSDVDHFTARFGHEQNVRIVGYVSHDQIPLWQAAADVLVLPNSAKEEISMHYTSPMKLFEYMASDRPIVASDLPSIREVLHEDAGYFARPDDPEDFARAIREALQDDSRSHRARDQVLEHSWQKRAERIMQRIV